MSIRSWTGVALALACATGIARADGDGGTAARATDGDAKRAVPDYDGRGNADADAGSWALWIPRGLLAPIYLVNEYVMRRPLGALVSRAERGRWVSALHDFFTFGPDQKLMLVPTALYDFGLSPSIGAQFTASDVFVAHHELEAHVATGGLHWLLASVRDRYHWNDGKTALATHVDFSRRPDLLFMGIGPDVRKSDRTRYGAQRLELGASLGHTTGPVQLAATAGVRHLAFRADDCCGDPRLVDAIRDQRIVSPPGFDTPYTAVYQGLALTLDSRAPRPAPGTGARLAIYGQSSVDPQHDRAWASYGVTAGGALDLNGHQRTLHLQVGVAFVDPIYGGDPPFTELATLGGDATMQGFVPGWMLGRSTAVAELGYTWPVAFLFDGAARISVGNAFDAQLDGFAANQLRLSADVGITTVASRDSGFELLVGFGSETFAQGGHIDSVRIAIGTRRGI